MDPSLVLMLDLARGAVEAQRAARCESGHRPVTGFTGVAEPIRSWRVAADAMFVETITSPGLAHLSYVVGDGGEAAVIDPRRACDGFHKGGSWAGRSLGGASGEPGFPAASAETDPGFAFGSTQATAAMPG
jgi:hypothetical protein